MKIRNILEKLEKIQLLAQLDKIQPSKTNQSHKTERKKNRVYQEKNLNSNREKSIDIKKESANPQIIIELPVKFTFKDHDVYDFDKFLVFFDWSLTNKSVRIDLTQCKLANYQALSLLVLYAWKLKTQGCNVTFVENHASNDASAMWKKMGARGAFDVLNAQGKQFKGDHFKPLFAVRENNDFKTVIESAEAYTANFNVEYEKTLRYVLGELLYNTMEHGKAYASHLESNLRIPSIVQFTWYKKRNEIHFVVADVGVGVKKHIEQAYPGQESDEAAIRLAIRPKVSGTFGRNDPYTNNNNAGMGLFISSNIISQLNADMYVVSGNGLLHISPRDVTGKTLSQNWGGTFVLVILRIEDDPSFILHKIMQDFRAAANAEQQMAQNVDQDIKFYVGIENYFGKYAEDKEAAIRFRDEKIFPSLNEGKIILIDFDRVVSSPHSFLSALLASPIKGLGLLAHKRVKIVNATPEIRETIDFIFDDNT